MSYKISVKEYIEKVQTGEINYSDFIIKTQEETEKLNKKFSFLNTITDLEYKQPEQIFYGIPFSVKDCICVKDVQSSAGSKILEGYKPPFDATCIKLVKDHGGVILGKTNQDEFGFGTFSTNSGFGIPKNPNDPTRSCGGSSGGAAGLTKALDYPHIAIAESTGGSISCPASYCGVYGLTPTYGLVSRYGLIDYANSLDKIGLMGKSIYEIALALSIIAYHDKKDSTSINKEYEFYMNNLGDDISKYKIGIPKEYLQGIDKGVEKSFWDSIKKMESLGCSYEEVSLPHTKFALPAYYIIATSEASTNLQKYCGMRYGTSGDMDKNMNKYFSEIRTKYFGEEAKRRILLGTFARMAGYRDAYYLKAMKTRTLIIQDFKKAFKNFDVLAAPTMPNIAPKFSEIEKLTPIENYMMDILTVAPNLAGIPMLSAPSGFVSGMPVGLHLMTDHLQERKLIALGDGFERL